MCAHLEKAAIEFKKQIESFRVYRGSKLSRDEVEKLRVGRLVACNGFLSSTRDLNVALNYIGIDPRTDNNLLCLKLLLILPNRLILG